MSFLLIVDKGGTVCISQLFGFCFKCGQNFYYGQDHLFNRFSLFQQLEGLQQKVRECVNTLSSVLPGFVSYSTSLSRINLNTKMMLTHTNLLYITKSWGQSCYNLSLKNFRIAVLFWMVDRISISWFVGELLFCSLGTLFVKSRRAIAAALLTIFCLDKIYPIN